MPARGNIFGPEIPIRLATKSSDDTGTINVEPEAERPRMQSLPPQKRKPDKGGTPAKQEPKAKRRSFWAAVSQIYHASGLVDGNESMRD